MNLLTLLGLLAGSLTTIAFLPQLWQTIKTKSTKDLSLVTLIIFDSGITLWLIYGIFRQDLPVIIANLITLILQILILRLKIIYG